MIRKISLILKSLKQRFLIIQGVRFLRKFFRRRKFSLLDAGCGNSFALYKRYLPDMYYIGLDNNKKGISYIALMDEFQEIDLTSLKFDLLPNVDAVVLNHVIEHLFNGEEVIKALSKKIKPGGLIYIEYPSPRSLKLPSMYGTLNFYDDATHCRLYAINSVKNLLNKDFKVIKSGARRDLRFILFTPLYALYDFAFLRKLRAGTFWDVLGFADYILAKKI